MLYENFILENQSRLFQKLYQKINVLVQITLKKRTVDKTQSTFR